MWLALTQSWCVLSKLTGYVSLGHVVFYGLGAYLVVVTWQQWPLPLAIAAAGARGRGCSRRWSACRCCACAGPYFVILTFGLAELVKYSILAVEAASRHREPHPVRRARPRSSSTSRCSPSPSRRPLLLVVVGRSRFGHGLRSLRENEEAAETLGVPVVRYKLLAFVLSAAIPGMVGAVMALRSTYFVVGQVFDPMISVTVIAMALLGGGDDAQRADARRRCSSSLVSELLWAAAPLAYMIILGAILIVFVLVVPDGHRSGFFERSSARTLRRRRGA